MSEHHEFKLKTCAIATTTTNYQKSTSHATGDKPASIASTAACQLVQGIKQIVHLGGTNTSHVGAVEQATQQHPNQLTMTSGRPYGDKTNSLTVGPRGPTLLQDIAYLDEIAHFDRERIPERAVHAKGNGAFGYFELTSSEIAKYCSAALFSGPIGSRTPIAARFSTVGGEKGSADTVRDPRGFAIKFYTQEGNLDIVGNNTPIFFIRDPMQFPSMVHSQKRHPQTNLKDPDAFWDFLSLRRESMHQVLFLFSDRGIPDGYRHMHGFGSHTFKLVNSKNQAFYAKFHFKTNQGIKNLDPAKAVELSGSDPDYSGRDLFESIKRKEFPSWRFCFQVMSAEQAEQFKEFNPFDITKTWSHKQFPLIEIGRIVLDRNPTNFFAEIEQLAFCPANMVPGIEPSPDKLLQGRLFSYSDAHRYRLGVNFNDLPVNRPHCPVMNPTFRDGAYCFNDNYGSLPNYYPNSQLTKINQDPKAMEHRQMFKGEVFRYDTSDDDNYTQAAVFWNKTLKQDERERLVKSMAEHLGKAKPYIQERMIDNCAKVSGELARMLAERLRAHA